jgi:hypothetical protein
MDMVWVLVRDYHTEGFSPPLQVFPSQEDGQRVMTLLIHATNEGYALKLMPVPFWPNTSIS